MPYDKEIPLYGDGIGSVRYIQHMGSDLTVVNSARVSFGVEKLSLTIKTENLLNISLNTDIHQLSSTMLLLSGLLCLYLSVHNIIDTVLGLIMKYREDIRTRR